MHAALTPDVTIAGLPLCPPHVQGLYVYDLYTDVIVVQVREGVDSAEGRWRGVCVGTAWWPLG